MTYYNLILSNLLVFLFENQIWTYAAFGFIGVAVIGLIVVIAAVSARKKSL